MSAKLVNGSLFSIGRTLSEKKFEKKTSIIGGKKVVEKGKLTADLGKPAMKATAAEKKAYINAAKSPAEKKKRVARINLATAHKKGLKAQGAKVPTPKSESIMKHMPVLAVVRPKYHFDLGKRH